MSDTYLHKDIKLYYKDLIKKSIKLKKHFDRHNNDWGEYRFKRKNKADHILKKEMSLQLREMYEENIEIVEKIDYCDGCTNNCNLCDLINNF